MKQTIYLYNNVVFSIDHSKKTRMEDGVPPIRRGVCLPSWPLLFFFMVND